MYKTHHYIYIQINMYINTCIQIYTRIPAYISSQKVPTKSQSLHTHTRTRTHAHAHAHPHAHTHTRTSKHTKTYLLIFFSRKLPRKVSLHTPPHYFGPTLFVVFVGVQRVPQPEFEPLCIRISELPTCMDINYT